MGLGLRLGETDAKRCKEDLDETGGRLSVEERRGGISGILSSTI